MNKPNGLFQPFADETAALLIQDLTIENRLDRVTLFGELDITKDKQGLAAARSLQAVLTSVIEVLQRDPLPDTVQVTPANEVRNPFGQEKRSKVSLGAPEYTSINQRE